MLLAQCLNAVDCELPRSLPWWFTVAVVAAWLALLVAIVKVVRWRRRSRVDRRDRVVTPAGWELEERAADPAAWELEERVAEPAPRALPALGEVSGRPGAPGEAG